MDNITQNIANNTRILESQRRKAFNMRINGEEHSASSKGGVANIYFPIDGQLMNVSECAFKLIFNDGMVSGGSWNESEIGTNMYPNLASWKNRWPLGSQIDVDVAYGCQCVDYANAFWYAQVDRPIITGTKHVAYEIWTVSREVNAGTEFDLITEWINLKPGDWAVWESPTTGHIAMVVSIDEDGVHFWSQNYRNSSDEFGSPLTEDIIPKTSTYLNFLGAFRYKLWN